MRNPKRRLGYGKSGVENVKNHEFFKGIDWNKVREKSLRVPFKPKMKDEEDTRNISKDFTSEKVIDTPMDPGLASQHK